MIRWDADEEHTETYPTGILAGGQFDRDPCMVNRNDLNFIDIAAVSICK